MAIKSADQISIVDITDAYSVVLSSESHTFVGGVSNALDGSATTQVYAFCGAEQVPVTVGDIECPSGVSAASDNNATSPTVTIGVTTSVKAGGVVKIPVTITGTEVTVVKEFSFGIAFKGSTGSKGDTGAAGKGVKSTEVRYQAGGSATSAPTGTWSENVVATTVGQYLWTRTVVTYTDNTTSTSYSVAAHGTTGAKGDTGAAGKGVKSTAVTYQVGNSPTSAPTGTWSANPVATTAAGQYLWTRTVITYTDNTTSTSYSVAAHGAKGDKGNTGAAGADAITVSITTSAGNIFKNSEGTTILTAHVYKAGAELNSTQIAALGTLKWYKDGGATAVGTGATLTVSAASINGKATYTVQLEG